jgi:hypothetical protein
MGLRLLLNNVRSGNYCPQTDKSNVLLMTVMERLCGAQKVIKRTDAFGNAQAKEGKVLREKLLLVIMSKYKYFLFKILLVFQWKIRQYSSEP